MSLFNFYDLPYESAVKILQKVNVPTTVNFYKASTYSNSIIEANCSLEKMEEEEKKKRNVEYFENFPVFYSYRSIIFDGYSGRSTFTNTFANYLSPWMSPFRTVSSEEIDKKANEKNKALIKQKKKARRAVKDRPVKHQFRHMNPRGKSFNFHQ